MYIRIDTRWMFGLVLMTVVSSSWAADPCQPGQPPRPLTHPDLIPDLPISPIDFTKTPDSTDSGSLEAAAAGFKDRAKAWSLAVAGPNVGVWESTVGAESNQRFAAASIGKSMTAVMVFQHIEAGKLSLDQSIELWFPELPEASSVTIDQLLTHRSGYFVPASGPLSGAYQPPETTFDQLIQQGPVFCPGEGWMYSNVAYQLLGRILEAVSGVSYAQLLSQSILEPLKLRQTHVLMPNQADEAMVQGHHGGQAVGFVDYASAYAAAPVSSTASDLVHYWHGLFTGKLVSPASLQRMMKPAFAMFGNDQMGYGAGLQVGNIKDGPGILVMHSGGITGFASTVAWLPEHQLFVAVMVNERQVPAEAALWALVRSLVDR